MANDDVQEQDEVMRRFLQHVAPGSGSLQEAFIALVTRPGASVKVEIVQLRPAHIVTIVPKAGYRPTVLEAVLVECIGEARCMACRHGHPVDADFRIRPTAGRCVICGCTDDRACDPPCHWVDDTRMLCSGCSSDRASIETGG